MTYSFLNAFTGRNADLFFDAIGMQTIRLKLGGVEIKPTPIVEYEGIHGLDAPDPLTMMESLPSYRASIPMETLKALFPIQANLQNAIAQGASALIMKPGDTAWTPLYVWGDYQWERSTDRVQLSLKGQGISDFG